MPASQADLADHEGGYLKVVETLRRLPSRSQLPDVDGFALAPCRSTNFVNLLARVGVAHCRRSAAPPTHPTTKSALPKQGRGQVSIIEPLEVSSDTSGPAKGGYPAAEVAASFCRSPRLETPPGFLPWPPLLPLQPVGVDSDAAGGGDAGGAGSGAAGTGGAEAGGAGSGGAGSGGARAGGAGGAPDGGTRGSSAGGAGAGGTRAGAGQRQHLHPQATLLPLQLCEWVSQRGAKPGGAGSGGAEPRGTDSGSADTGGAEPCYNVVVVVVLRATKGPTEGSAKATLTGVRSGVRSVQSRKKYMDATESKVKENYEGARGAGVGGARGSGTWGTVAGGAGESGARGTRAGGTGAGGAGGARAGSAGGTGAGGA
ncbi:unnamed protein product [Closterium sp. NIES-54]